MRDWWRSWDGPQTFWLKWLAKCADLRWVLRTVKYFDPHRNFS
jgi:hypothetical protein